MFFPPKLPIPPEVLSIVKKLEGEGYETWCVGGAIRDNLLGYDNSDYDLATAAEPDRVRKIFRRTIPIGVEHGTVAVLDEHDQPHEVTTFRKDVKTDGRHAVVEFGVEFDEDLARRDFTVNAIAYHALRGEWKDPFDGRGDLEKQSIRSVGDPLQRFREDYLRILRGIRFACRFGFSIEEDTWSAAKECAEGLPHLSAERVRDEWFKGIKTAKTPSHLVDLWREVGAFELWMPEVGEPGAGSRELVDRLDADDPVLVTAFLSSDPGATLSRLRCSRAEVERGRAIGRYREDLPDAGDRVAVRRWMSRVGSSADDLIAVARATEPSSRLAVAVDGIRSAGHPLGTDDLTISGNDLIEMGLSEGPAVGRILSDLLETVLVDPNKNNRDDLLEMAKELIAELGANHSPLPTPRGGRDGEGQ